MNFKNMQTVCKAHGRLMAETIRAFLESQGINAILDQDALGQIYGLTIGDLGEVKIMVPQSQLEEAKSLLDAMEAGEFENTELFDEQETAFDEETLLDQE